MNELKFKEDLIKDLQGKDIAVHSLGEGTLDLYFEDLGILGEIKRVGTGIISGKSYYP